MGWVLLCIGHFRTGFGLTGLILRSTSDTETSDSNLAIIDISSNKYKPLETFISDDILLYPNASYIYDALG